MRILITNDDGIHSEGLRILTDWAGKLGEVTVAAPKAEQSGKSHAIEIVHPFSVEPLTLENGVRAFSIDSTPADCVRYAILGLREQFDLVISGINRGLNIGRDIIYSGTAGAVFEAAALDVPRALAISTEPSSFESALANLDRVYAFFKKHDLFSVNGIYNVNIPKDPKSIRITRQGGPYYSDEFPSYGGNLVMPTGKSIFRACGDLTLDTDATLGGHISISPLTIIRTDLGAFERLSALKVEEIPEK
ncbi:MAG: 5'/3'-nucleotidase SurE [Clostridia bacterium]|nr:5'/3'-nucleotidase SurE [Clostridia bacterium]MBQ5833327.1 5'/3'-nucleotidase SurE [Clostridia bacterium]